MTVPHTICIAVLAARDVACFQQRVGNVRNPIVQCIFLKGVVRRTCLRAHVFYVPVLRSEIQDLVDKGVRVLD